MNRGRLWHQEQQQLIGFLGEVTLEIATQAEKKVK
jgi:hypothetical protein